MLELFDQYDYRVYKIIRIIVFTCVGFLLIKSLQEEYKLILSLLTLFIVLDYFLPNVYYE